MCVMGDFTRVPHISSPAYSERLRSALIAGALGDALGYPLELLSATIAWVQSECLTHKVYLVTHVVTQIY